MTNSIDLHIHTNASDGSDSVAQLLEALLAKGIRTFSVTDHDTIDGAVAMEALAPAGVRYIRGIEFSCLSSQGKCHILGYGFDPGDPVFLSALDRGRQLRREKQERRLAFLESRFGIRLTEAEAQWLQAQKSPGKPHLGTILVNRGLAPDLDTAIQHYVNLHKDANDRIEARMAVRAIRHAGGVPVWAHPLGGEGERRLTREQFEAQLAELMDCGIRGLECCYSRYTPAEIAFLTARAEAHSLLVSGGSDYHGKNKPGLSLGQLNADHTPVDPACLTILRAL